jgi:enoyl-[acyl-carrier protein] reductase II
MRAALACWPRLAHDPPICCGAELQATKALATQPFGVNLIVMSPHLAGLAEVRVEENIGHVVLAGGTAPQAVIKQLTDGGCRVIAFAPACSAGANG